MSGQGDSLMAANTAPKIQPAGTTAERFLQHVELTHAAMEKAAAFQAAVDNEKAVVQSKIAAACDALITNERARPEERDKLAAALADHATLLDLVQSIAAHRTPAEAGRLGQGQATPGTKTAGQNSDRPFAAAKMRKAAGARLFQQLGLAVPADE